MNSKHAGLRIGFFIVCVLLSMPLAGCFGGDENLNGDNTSQQQTDYNFEEQNKIIVEKIGTADIIAPTEEETKAFFNNSQEDVK